LGLIIKLLNTLFMSQQTTNNCIWFEWRYWRCNNKTYMPLCFLESCTV